MKIVVLIGFIFFVNACFADEMAPVSKTIMEIIKDGSVTVDEEIMFWNEMYALREEDRNSYMLVISMLKGEYFEAQIVLWKAALKACKTKKTDVHKKFVKALIKADKIISNHLGDVGIKYIGGLSVDEFLKIKNKEMMRRFEAILLQSANSCEVNLIDDEDIRITEKEISTRIVNIKKNESLVKKLLSSKHKVLLP